MMKKILVFFFLLSIVLRTSGNAGVFRGSGQTPVLEKSSEVQMVEEEVVMIPRRGDYPVDTSCRNLDKMEFHCRFLLRNLSGNRVVLQVGFPLSTEALFFRNPAEINQSEIVNRFAFTAGTREKVYPVRFVPRDKERRFSNLFLWEMTFSPHETMELFVNYTMEGYLGLGSTCRREVFSREREYRCAYLDFLTTGLEQRHFYVTETGSSWAGVIEKAVFRYYPFDFEEYLAGRGAWEESGSERIKRLERRKKHPGQFNHLFSPSMPMIRVCSPEFERWRTVEGKKRHDRCLEVVFQPFTPKKNDPITIRYLFPCIPVNAEQFELFNQTLKLFLEKQAALREKIRKEKPERYEKYWKNRKTDTYSPSVRKNIADVVLEFHGIPRNNPEIADFLADQHWYPVRQPRKIEETYKQMLLKISAEEGTAALSMRTQTGDCGTPCLPAGSHPK